MLSVIHQLPQQLLVTNSGDELAVRFVHGSSVFPQLKGSGPIGVNSSSSPLSGTKLLQREQGCCSLGALASRNR